MATFTAETLSCFSMPRGEAKAYGIPKQIQVTTKECGIKRLFLNIRAQRHAVLIPGRPFPLDHLKTQWYSPTRGCLPSRDEVTLENRQSITASRVLLALHLHQPTKKDA